MAIYRPMHGQWEYYWSFLDQYMMSRSFTSHVRTNSCQLSDIMVMHGPIHYQQELHRLYWSSMDQYITSRSSTVSTGQVWANVLLLGALFVMYGPMHDSRSSTGPIWTNTQPGGLLVQYGPTNDQQEFYWLYWSSLGQQMTSRSSTGTTGPVWNNK